MAAKTAAGDAVMQERYLSRCQILVVVCVNVCVCVSCVLMQAQIKSVEFNFSFLNSQCF